MLDERLLLELAVVEGTLATLAYVVLIAHAVARTLARRRNAASIAAARAGVAAVLHAASPALPRAAALARLSPRRQIRVLAELAVSLGGEQRERLLSLAAEAGLEARAHRWCGSRLWWRRMHGARLLGLLGSGASVVPALFGDRRAEVRAQAAEWASGNPSEPVLGRLVEMLADPANVCRFTVKDSLLRIGRPAVEPLMEHLSTRSGEAAVSGLVVAVGLADPRFLGCGLRFAADPCVRTRVLGAALVGSLGGAEAARALVALLRDPEPSVRAAAAKGLGAVGHWPASPALIESLRDPAFTARRQAALALRALGAPGLLLLRRALADSDRVARDMAQSVLDQPDTAARPAAA